MTTSTGCTAGWGRGEAGDRSCLAYAERGTLTFEQKQRLADQAVLEKLSHDVYGVFADKTGDPRFEHIAGSESRHLHALRVLMDRYNVTDPTKGLGEGKFSGAASNSYSAYVQGSSSSLQAALDTAQQIEKNDIAGLKKAGQGLDAPDVEQVYAHLTHPSQMHLAVFSG